MPICVGKTSSTRNPQAAHVDIMMFVPTHVTNEQSKEEAPEDGGE